MTTSIKKASLHRQMKIVQNYDSGNSLDLVERLKVVFEPWLSTVYNNDKKGGTNDEGRSNNQSFDNPAT